MQFRNFSYKNQVNSIDDLLIHYFYLIVAINLCQLLKIKNKSAKASKSIKDASVSPATTRDKDKALQAVIGMWADREDLQRVKIQK